MVFSVTAASELAKKAWLWLGQRGQTTLDDAAPARYELEVHALTSEKYAVVLQAVYTVGPKIIDGASDEKNPVEDEEPLLLRAKLAAPDPHIMSKEKGSRCPRHVRKLLERHVGAVAAGMTMGQVLAMEGGDTMVKEALSRVNLDLDLANSNSASIERVAVQVPTDRVSFAVVAEEVEVSVNNREATVAMTVVHPATKQFDRDSETTVAGVGGVLRIGLAQQSSPGKQASAMDAQVIEL